MTGGQLVGTFSGGYHIVSVKHSTHLSSPVLLTVDCPIMFPWGVELIDRQRQSWISNDKRSKTIRVSPGFNRGCL